MTSRESQKEIQSWDEVPLLASEEEERAFWRTHTLGEKLLAQIAKGPPDPDLPPPRPRTGAQPISVRVDADLLGRLKAIARERSVGYQTLLKQWLAERLAIEEARNGELHDIIATPEHTTALQGETNGGIADPEAMSHYLATLLATMSEAAVLSIADAASGLPLPPGVVGGPPDYVHAVRRQHQARVQLLRRRLHDAVTKFAEEI
ncbi:MAG: CopG family antitoxin [Dehalococcoidia bacterium]